MNDKTKLKIVLNVAVCVLFISAASFDVIGKTLSNRNFAKEVKDYVASASGDIPKPPSSHLLPFRQILKPNDEGSHHKNHFMTQEWWYYNVVFDKSDSELRNWSLMISFNQMKEADIFFLTLYDEGNKSYGGAVPGHSGAIQATGPGVNVEFNDSYVIGTYPTWHIYAEDEDMDDREIIVDLTYEANSLPLWTVMNTGHNIFMSPGGHYCIIDCNVTGEVRINETVYKVHGVGYHEHSWATFLPWGRGGTFIKNIWDYYRIHFDNGWNILAGKLDPLHQSPFTRFIPGLLCFTPDGENVMECLFFRTKYLETKNTPISGVDIPTKIRINALFVNTIITNPLKGLIYLDICMETKNIHDYLYGSPPTAGMWEGPCKVSGTIRWSKNNIKLDGWAMIELIRTAS